MKHPVLRRLACFLTGSLLVFLGLYATLSCFVTVFDLPAEEPLLLLSCLLSAFLFSGLFALPKLGWRIGLLAVLTVGVGLLIRKCAKLLLLGILVCGQSIANNLSIGLGTGEFLPFQQALWGSAPLWQRRGAAAVLLILILVLSCWLGWAIVRRRSFWLAFLGTLPFLALPMSVTLTPHWFPLLLLLLFWSLCLLARLVRGGGALAGVKVVWGALAPCLALLLCIGLILPGAEYTRAPWADDLRLRIFSAFRWDANGLFSIPDMPPPALPNWDIGVPLASSGPPRFNGSTALRVTSDTSGHIYLRGFSAARYTLSGWEPLAPEAYESLDLSLYPPQGFPARACLDRAPGSTRYTVKNLAAVPYLIYTPYQPVTNGPNLAGGSFSDDVCLTAATAYPQAILRARENASLQIAGALPPEELAAESAYRAFVAEHYTQVPEELAPTLSSLLNSAGIPTLGPDPIRGGDLSARRLAAAQSVKTLLSQLARYDLTAPAPPEGEDFTLYFLTQSHRGYCMHFATAATLLLRELGVPARYVSGYVADTVAGQTVDVPDHQAHAWVEVYLDGYGWQPVEVTAGFSGDFPWTAEIGETPYPTPTPSPTPSAVPTPTPTATPQTSGAPQEIGPAFHIPLQWLLPPGILLLAAALFCLRRRLAARARARRFSQPDTNRAVLALYDYSLAILRRAPGETMAPPMEALAKKAAFSQHKLTEEERRYAQTWARALAARTAGAQNPVRRLLFHYLWALD